jgi:hypothetical protein
LLVRLLSVSTEGKNGVAEATCQNLYTPENVLEHLKVTANCLDLKTAFLELLSNVYLDTDDPLDSTEAEVCNFVP